MARAYRFPDEIIRSLIERSAALREQSAVLQRRAQNASRNLRRLMEAVRFESGVPRQFAAGQREGQDAAGGDGVAPPTATRDGSGSSEV